MATIPDIGLGGLINSVRKLSGYVENPGWRKVDPAATFMAGQVANLETDSTTGEPILTVATNSDTTGIVGLFYCHKTTTFYKSVQEEAQTFGTSPNTAAYLFLNHANVKSGSVLLTTAAGVAYTITTDWTLYSATNGVILRTSAGSAPGATTAVLVSYLYEDSDLYGVDQTLGSGMAATLEGVGEIATLVYATSVQYTLNGALYVDSSGYITSAGGSKQIGKVTKVPDSENPELHFKMNLA